MKCIYLHGGSCLDKFALADTRIAARRIAGLLKAPMQTLCALAAVAALAVGLAAVRRPAVASGNTIPDDFSMNDSRPSDRTAREIPAGIQDPLDPQAYIEQLAARMSQGRRELLLMGTTLLSATPRPQATSGQPVGQRGAAPSSSARPAPTIPAAADIADTPANQAKTIPSTFGGPALGVQPPERRTRLGVVPDQDPRMSQPALSNTVQVGGINASLVSPTVTGGATPADAGLRRSPAAGAQPTLGAQWGDPSAGGRPNQPTPYGLQASAFPNQTALSRPTGVSSAGTPVFDRTARTANPPLQARASAKSNPTVWSGLSPRNGAAQRALQEIQAERVAQASAAGSDNPAAQVAQAAPTAPNMRPDMTVDEQIRMARPGLTLWVAPSPANLAAKMNVSDGQVPPPADPADVPWSLGPDLDKYRAHAVKEGSRDSGESLMKALERAGMALEDGVNVFVLGYGSERAEPFRANDGKGWLEEPQNVPVQAGITIGEVGDGLYSLADLIALDSLPNPEKGVYEDNNPVVRPLLFTGRTIGGAWKTTEEIGNAVTWGYFDNVTGCIGLCIESILELLKHTGQAVTNIARAPVQLIGGKNEETERAMDWILLVPLEFASNTVEMKGIANTVDYENAFADKGVIGSLLEFGGSTFLVYRTVDELIDELEDDGHRKRTSQETPVADEPSEPPAPPAEPPSTPSGWDLVWMWNDGEAMSDLVFRP